MDNNRKLVLNTIAPLILEAVSVVSGFVIPRLIMTYYGSEVNGLTQSIMQFLSVISFMEMGVGGVIQFNLYKPLAEKDNNQISRIVVAANKFFKTIALVLVVYTVVLIFAFPKISNQSFDILYTGVLIVAISFSYFSQYYFGQVNQLLLNADQRGYIQYFASIACVIANTIACVTLIMLGCGIHFVKITTSVVFLFKPVLLYFYVHKHYSINYKIKYEGEPIKQKWNGIAQHLSYVILDNTDIIVLTSFSTLSNVSIYSAYYLVVGGLKKLMTTATSGIQARIGNIIARNDKIELDYVFQIAEWTIHTVATFIFTCTAILIVPFVKVYTSGVTDANYIQPLFGLLITIAFAGHSYRLPYSCVILAAGHYKQTQWSYISAALANVVVSIILVIRQGLVGVAIGTIVAMFMQTIWMGIYSYRNILGRKLSLLSKQLTVNTATFLGAYEASKLWMHSPVGYLDWICMAVLTAFIVGAIIMVLNLILYRSNTMYLYHRFMRKQ